MITNVQPHRLDALVAAITYDIPGTTKLLAVTQADPGSWQPQPGDAVAVATPGRTGYASITDYNGQTMNGIQDAEGQAIAGLEAYGASISVQPAAFEGIAASEGWWIHISVTGPQGQALQLAQWRSRK